MRTAVPVFLKEKVHFRPFQRNAKKKNVCIRAQFLLVWHAALNMKAARTICPVCDVVEGRMG